MKRALLLAVIVAGCSSSEPEGVAQPALDSAIEETAIDSAPTDSSSGMDALDDSSLADTAPLDAASDVSSDSTPDAKDSAADSESADAPVDTCVPPAGSVCGTWPQCGCATPFSCDFVGTVRGCRGAGTGGVGTRCSASDKCAFGLTCLAGRCTTFCDKSSDCTVPGEVCVHVHDGPDGAEISGYNACAKPCSPINPSSACGAAAGCAFIDYSFGVTSCAGAGTATSAGSCASDATACAPGYACSAGDCRRWCRVGFPGDCPTGKTCTELAAHPKLGAVEYGLCSL